MRHRSITVIVPFRNQLNWLRQAVHSLQQQTVQDWRAILINDHSDPNVVCAVEEVCGQDKRLRLMHVDAHQHLPGPWLPRNVGIRAAKTDLIAFLDADDLWHPQKLELQLNAHREAKVLSVCSYVRFLNESGQIIELRRPPSTITFQRLLRGNQIPLSTVVVDRALLSQHQGFQPEHHEDYGLWLRIFATQSQPNYQLIDQPLVAYRLHAQSVSAKRSRSIFAVNKLFRQHTKNSLERLAWLAAWLLARACSVILSRLRSKHLATDQTLNDFRLMILPSNQGPSVCLNNQHVL